MKKEIFFPISVYLNNSIEPWQRGEIQKVAMRAYKLGKKHQKKQDENLHIKS